MVASYEDFVFVGLTFKPLQELDGELFLSAVCPIAGMD
jgi:hypothetical protein